MKKKPTTASDLIARLAADPEFVSKRDRVEVDREKRVAEWRIAESPLVEELRAAGCDINSVWDLVASSTPYLSALPILLDHLERPYPPSVREGIARALAIPQARVGWSMMVRMYQNENDGRAKDGLAVALAAACDDGVISDILDLARNPSHGPSRLLLLSALERHSGSSPDWMLELESDPGLADEVRVIRRRQQSTRKRGK